VQESTALIDKYSNLNNEHTKIFDNEGEEETHS
jgi:hypothetical protein